MKKLLIILAAALSLSACTTTEQGAGVGAVAGGVLGAATTGTVAGTAVGAGIGAVAGAVLARAIDDPTQCWYWGDRHHTYKVKRACPDGY
jgi:surface antigen